jgi:hypothetical protein
MPHYKTLENFVIFLDPSNDLADHEKKYLPAGTVKITSEEAESIRNAKLIDFENKKTYAEKRAGAYPSFADQFDLLYHSGFDAWKAAIKTVKDQYPKI